METDEDRLSLVFSRLKEAVLVENANRTVKFANQAFVDLFAPGLVPEMLEDADCDQAAIASAELFIKSDEWLDRTREIVQLGQNISDEEWQLKDGRWLARDYAVREVDGKVFEHMWIYRDTTAMHEKSTSVPSDINSIDAHHFHGVTQGVLARVDDMCSRNPSHLSMALVKLIAMDRVNSELGFQFGDSLISGVLADLESEFGVNNVTRLRGATFVVLSEKHPTDTLMKKIDELLAPSRRLDDQVIMLRYGIGITALEIIGEPFDATFLLNSAQIALRTALATHRHTIANPSMLSRDKALKDLDLKLPIAIDQGQFHMLFQPQRDLLTMEPIGFEALLRWTHPERGAISAAEFIPLAEEMNLIPQIDYWVMRNVIPQINDLLAWGGSRVAINLSAQTLENEEELINTLTSLCDAEGVSPESIDIEVTESAVAHNPETMHVRLQNLRELGFGIAIDDFGVGQSSLALLKDIPFTTLKLDRSFVEDLGKPRVAELVRAMAHLADIFGSVVLAEGVETPEQVEQLTKAGVSAGQGWLLGVPKPVNYYLDGDQPVRVTT